MPVRNSSLPLARSAYCGRPLLPPISAAGADLILPALSLPA